MAKNPEQQALDQPLQASLQHISQAFDQAIAATPQTIIRREIGRVAHVSKEVAIVKGLPAIQFRELIRFQSGDHGYAFNLDPDEVGVVLLANNPQVQAGQRAHRTERVIDVPVGRSLVGRVVNALGVPQDELGRLRGHEKQPVEQAAPDMMVRSPVERPLQTGVKVIDAMIPIGRGQRELILGDRQTGKTTLAIDAILNQKDQDVVCIYCAIGQRKAAVANVIATLRQHQAMQYTFVVVASGEDAPGLQYIAPYAATTMAEFFVHQGQDALIVYDDLTRHARAYREISLLLGRPPGREAYPGDIFYVHARLLERATQLKDEQGGGSLTALPIIETQAQNIAAYIPTNLVSITDGQIYLSPKLFQKGILPAVDIGRSVSRVGGKAQLPAFQETSSDLRLAYSQLEELEIFTRFGTRLDEETQRQLTHGRRVRKLLQQGAHQPLSAAHQIALLFLLQTGVFDEVPLDMLPKAEELIRKRLDETLPETRDSLSTGQTLDEQDQQKLSDLAHQVINQLHEEAGDAQH